MILLVGTFGRKFDFRNCFVAAMASDRTFLDTSRRMPSRSTNTAPTTEASSSSPKIYRTVQVQIVHRHGDRTPITPLKDEDFWASTLVPPETLEKISSNTHLIQDDSQANNHRGAGRGPFGKLTELGLLQLIKVGSKLRGELVTDQLDHEIVDDKGNRHFPHVYHPQRPLDPSNIRVFSTNFPRTIQSVQGLLVGLFPDSTDESIPIDVRHTVSMVPDYPQLAKAASIVHAPHILRKDQEMVPLAARATRALLPLLGPDALNFSLAPNNGSSNNAHTTTEPLEWNQLAEITKCLAVRNMLPPQISLQDQQAISRHAAWRWFEITRDERLGFLGLDEMRKRQVESMCMCMTEPPVTVWSGHDFTLTGLVVAYRLEQPAVWPEYGSYLKLELLQVSSVSDEQASGKKEYEYVVRFSLNGETLRSNWNGELQELIPLHVLRENVGCTDS
jgi:acid phosphatase